MAALSITPAAVIAEEQALVERGTAGATLAAGDVLYKDDDGTVKLADADAGSKQAKAVGIALHGAEPGQPIAWVSQGDLQLGAILDVGEIYIASATAGGISPVGDLAAGWRTSILGVAKSATTLSLRINNSDAVVPGE